MGVDGENRVRTNNNNNQEQHEHPGIANISGLKCCGNSPKWCGNSPVLQKTDLFVRKSGLQYLF